jgi:hypothetical protein
MVEPPGSSLQSDPRAASILAIGSVKKPPFLISDNQISRENMLSPVTLSVRADRPLSKPTLAWSLSEIAY